MQLSLTAALGGTITVVGLVIAAVMYFEEQFAQVEEHLSELSTEMATQTQRLDDIHIRAAEARAGREELDDGIKRLSADLAGLRKDVYGELRYHAGEHGRFEGAADRFEELLRRLQHE